MRTIEDVLRERCVMQCSSCMGRGIMRKVTVRCIGICQGLPNNMGCQPVSAVRICNVARLNNPRRFASVGRELLPHGNYRGWRPNLKVSTQNPNF